jgi:regulator of sigma E protease
MLNVLLIVFWGIVMLALIVFIHEGGHFLAAKAFGVRVTEFMIGLPGPRISFSFHGTRFGVTCIPLGGYTRICGMEGGRENPNLVSAYKYIARYGSLTDVQADNASDILGFDLLEALDVLEQWGTVERVRIKRGQRKMQGASVGVTESAGGNSVNGVTGSGTWQSGGSRSSAGSGTSQVNEPYYRYELAATSVNGVTYIQGQPRHIEYDIEAQAFIDFERKQTYRGLPWWKRIVILFAGAGVNLIFALVVFIAVLCANGTGIQDALGVSFSMIGQVIGAIVQLFDPATFQATISQSASVVGVSVIAKNAAAAGFLPFIVIAASLSVSIGLMNLLPIPPLDGGKIIIETIERIAHRNIPVRVVNGISVAAMVALVALFVVVTNQDIHRFILGG